jgi:hypothetical protein
MNCCGNGAHLTNEPGEFERATVSKGGASS